MEGGLGSKMATGSLRQACPALWSRIEPAELGRWIVSEVVFVSKAVGLGNRPNKAKSRRGQSVRASRVTPRSLSAMEMESWERSGWEARPGRALPTRAEWTGGEEDAWAGEGSQSIFSFFYNLICIE